MRILTHRGRRRLAATAVAASLGLAGLAQAQYAPYNAAQPPVGVAQPQYGTAQPQHAPVQPQYNPYVVKPPTAQAAQAPAPQPQYAAQGAYAGYAAAQTAPIGPTPGYAPAPTYASPDGAPRVAMAFQGGAQNPQPTLSEPMTLTPPIDTVGPGAAPNGVYAPQPIPESYPAAGAGMGYAPGGGYETYPAADASAGGGYGACDANGSCNSYTTYSGMSGVLGKHAGGGYWFGGAYLLLMDRDNSNHYPLAFANASMADGSYPAAPNTVLSTRDADIGYQGGIEFRLGRAFGGGAADACDCSCSCGPRWGLETAYWTLFDDDDTAVYYDQAATRTYTMMPMYGLEYDAGAGYVPVNHVWDYAPPSQTANNYAVSTVRVHSSLEVQNLELNLLRLGACGGGYGPAIYGAAVGVDACSGESCDTTCAPCAPCGPRYSCTAVCGFRWMEFDEDFMFGADYYEIANPANFGYANYWSLVDNNLFGAQIGCNGMYRIGCKWGFHLNTLVGLYGNDVDVRQYFVSTGDVRIIGTGEDFDVVANKTDVAMLGELRIGASYQASCHCRLYAGWRAIGVTGIALATDQTPNAAFISAAQMNNYVNSNGSMILHGLQTGVEFNY